MNRKQPSFHGQYLLSTCYDPDTALGLLDMTVPTTETVLLPEYRSLQGKENIKLML